MTFLVCEQGRVDKGLITNTFAFDSVEFPVVCIVVAANESRSGRRIRIATVDSASANDSLQWKIRTKSELRKACSNR